MLNSEESSSVEVRCRTCRAFNTVATDASAPKCVACEQPLVLGDDPPPSPVAAPIKEIDARPRSEQAQETVQQSPASGSLGYQERELLIRRKNSGANWFYWIAGLSMVNSVGVASESDWGFPVGLGATLVVDVIGKDLGSSGSLVALVISAMIAGTFCLFAVMGRRGKVWAFLVGMGLYGLDAVLYLLFADWMSFAFHVFALFWIYAGFSALRKLRQDEVRHEAVVPLPAPATRGNSVFGNGPGSWGA